MYSHGNFECSFYVWSFSSRRSKQILLPSNQPIHFLDTLLAVVLPPLIIKIKRASPFTLHSLNLHCVVQKWLPHKLHPQSGSMIDGFDPATWESILCRFARSLFWSFVDFLSWGPPQAKDPLCFVFWVRKKVARHRGKFGQQSRSCEREKLAWLLTMFMFYNSLELADQH